MGRKRLIEERHGLIRQRNGMKNFAAAWRGCGMALREERNRKIHVAAVLLVVVFGFYFKISSAEWIALLTMIAFVICAELLNTSIENRVDRISKETHPQAGKVKDVAGRSSFSCCGHFRCGGFDHLCKIF